MREVLSETRNHKHRTIMTTIKSFTFSPFAENSYVLSNKSNDCLIIDPGCYTENEQQHLVAYINERQLKPVRLLNTHCHLDHIFGNQFVFDTWGLLPETHEGELPVLERGPASAQMFGVQLAPSPKPEKFLAPGDVIKFGEAEFEVKFAPGHSPASICFYNAAEKFVIAGDVLFQRSIGRTDLPGGDMTTLMESIFRELLPLDDDVVVYPGHGPSTTIGAERKSNPFILSYQR